MNPNLQNNTCVALPVQWVPLSLLVQEAYLRQKLVKKKEEKGKKKYKKISLFNFKFGELCLLCKASLLFCYIAWQGLYS